MQKQLGRECPRCGKCINPTILQCRCAPCTTSGAVGTTMPNQPTPVIPIIPNTTYGSQIQTKPGINNGGFNSSPSAPCY